jgi:uncharacterized membrane-anchored protein
MDTEHDPSHDPSHVPSHDPSPYLGLAVLILSVLNLDSSFDPDTLSQLAELIATIITGAIGIGTTFYIVKNKNGNKVESESKKATDIND